MTALKVWLILLVRGPFPRETVIRTEYARSVFPQDVTGDLTSIGGSVSVTPSHRVVTSPRPGKVVSRPLARLGSCPSVDVLTR